MILTVKPYLMDLETTNGTYLNGDKIDDQRYYEVIVKEPFFLVLQSEVG